MGKGVSTLREVEPRLLRIKEAAAYLAQPFGLSARLPGSPVPHVVSEKRILV